jgi:ABC-type proline/glycine betaine transport system permease subunit
VGRFFQRSSRDGLKLVGIGIALFVGSYLVLVFGQRVIESWRPLMEVLIGYPALVVGYLSPLVVLFGLAAMTGLLDRNRRRRQPQP